MDDEKTIERFIMLGSASRLRVVAYLGGFPAIAVDALLHGHEPRGFTLSSDAARELADVLITMADEIDAAPDED